ncbi:hypothetical protein Tco_1338633 [Tanacetum coccineum]
MNMDQDKQMLMVDDNVGNQFRQNVVQNVGNLVGQNAVQNQGIQMVGNQNGLSVISRIGNQHGNENVVAARAEGNVKPRKRDAAYLHKQMQIAQKEEGGIQLTSEEFDFMANVGACKETDRANANYGSAEVSNVEQGVGTVEQHSVTVDETHAYHESLFHNLASKVEKVNLVNLKMKNAELTTELARYKNQQAQQKQQSLYNGKVLLEKHDPPTVYDLEETLELAQEKANESLAKHKALELEIERLLRAVVGQDIMSIVQNNYVVDTSNLQTELERMKEGFENYIIKKENEYAKLWNDWYKKCEECKYDKISYDKAYNNMQQKIEQLQTQLGDPKGKSKDTPCVSDTFDSLPQKLKNENVELEFQVSEQKDTTKGTSTNTKFANQSTERKPSLQSLRNTSVVRQPKAFQSKRLNFLKTRVPQKVDKSNDLLNPVTSNSVPLADESWVEAMQEELLQFKLQEVWVLCDLPEGKRVIGTKWVFRNKRDVTGYYYQEQSSPSCTRVQTREGVDYEEVFATCCRIDALRTLFWHLHLSWASLFEFLLNPNKVTELIKGGFMACIKPQEHEGDSCWYRYLVDEYHFGSTKSSMVKDFEDLMQKEFKMSSMGNDEEGEDVDISKSLQRFLIYMLSKGSLAFSDSDYAGDNHDKDNTSGGMSLLLGMKN